MPSVLSTWQTISRSLETAASFHCGIQFQARGLTVQFPGILIFFSLTRVSTVDEDSVSASRGWKAIWYCVSFLVDRHQNRFGVTHVCCVDRFVGLFLVQPRKRERERERERGRVYFIDVEFTVRHCFVISWR